MKKLLEFKKQVNKIKKDGKNPHFKSNYATLPQILSEVKPLLSDLGLVLTQHTLDGKVWTSIIDVETGEVANSNIDIPQGLNPQQLGSALTYYRRQLLAGLLSLEIADDDDGRLASAPPRAEKPTFTEDNFERAFKANATIEMIRERYNITKEVEQKYFDYVSSAK